MPRKSSIVGSTSVATLQQFVAQIWTKEYHNTRIVGSGAIQQVFAIFKGLSVWDVIAPTFLNITITLLGIVKLIIKLTFPG